jgi:hypothetical protein
MAGGGITELEVLVTLFQQDNGDRREMFESWQR